MRRRNTAAVGDDEFDPRVSLAWERLLVQRDYDLLSSLKGRPVELREGLGKLEKMIREQGAASDLEKLCSLKCDRSVLLWLLHPFSSEPIFKDAGRSNKPGIGSIKSLFGITSKKLQSLIKKLNEVAIQVEMVNEQREFGVVLKTHPLYGAWRLPRTLRMYVRLLRYGARHLAANSDIFHNVAKARLTSYVVSRSKSRTKRGTTNFRDEEIAALISAASGDENCRYDATAHRVWRNKHYHRLYLLDPNLDSHDPLTRLDSALPSES